MAVLYAIKTLKALVIGSDRLTVYSDGEWESTVKLISGENFVVDIRGKIPCAMKSYKFNWDILNGVRNAIGESKSYDGALANIKDFFFFFFWNIIAYCVLMINPYFLFLLMRMLMLVDLAFRFYWA